MAVLGRRQPHGPIILRPGTPASVSRLVTPAGAGDVQAAAAFAHRPLFRPIIKTAGTPPSVARFILRGDRTSRDASLFARRPLFRPIIGTIIQYAAPAAPAPVAARPVVYGQGTAREAALFARRPLFQPIFKTAGAPPPIAGIVSPRGQGPAQAAALAGRQPRIFRPWIAGLIQYAPPQPSGFIAPPPQMFGRRASQEAAQFASRQAWRPARRTSLLAGVYPYSGSSYYEPQLQDEINAAGITTGTLLYVSGTGATAPTGTGGLATAVIVVFDHALSAADTATLNGVVAGHSPNDYGGTGQPLTLHKAVGSGMLGTTYTVKATDDVLVGDCSSAPVFFNLPPVKHLQVKPYWFKSVGAFGSTTITAAAGENIEDVFSNTYTLTTGQGVVLIPCGTLWYALAKF